MNILVSVVFPVDSGNAAVADHGFGGIIQKIFADQKAESVYFHPSDGQRAISYVSDVSDGSRLPSLVEPWWLRFRADVTLTPVFTPAEMEKAVPGIVADVKKYYRP
jgi:hypothetical protein